MAARTANRQSDTVVQTPEAAEVVQEMAVETAETPVEATVEAEKVELVREDGESDEAYDARVQAAAAEEEARKADPFGALEAAVEAEYVRGPRAIDWEAVTSPRIKADLQKSYDKYEPAKDEKGNVLVNKAGRSHWLTQKFPNADMAAAYVKAAKKYATFKEWTFRSGFQDDTTVRFCAKPKETARTGAGSATAASVTPAPEVSVNKSEAGF